MNNDDNGPSPAYMSGVKHMIPVAMITSPSTIVRVQLTLQQKL
jgi:hypothetical protein